MCTFKLLLSRLVCPLWLLCSPHARIAVAVHTCIIRVLCVEAGFHMLLGYPMLYLRIGLFPSQPVYIVMFTSIT